MIFWPLLNLTSSKGRKERRKMLGFRKIGKADISKGHRQLFEQCGVATIQLTLASGHTPASALLRGIYINAENLGSDAEAWLIEQADKHANKEWRIEVAEWAVLIFVILGVIVDVLLLLKGK
jgi:hypothetical protein